MSFTVDDALKRLENALGLLEASVSRRLELERRRGDLETELQIMPAARARGAVERDGARTRLNRAAAAAEDVGVRVKRAIGAIESVLERAEPVEPE